MLPFKVVRIYQNVLTFQKKFSLCWSTCFGPHCVASTSSYTNAHTEILTNNCIFLYVIKSHTIISAGKSCGVCLRKTELKKIN